MSDAPQGDGWWQASDGRWYAPEAHPNHATTPPPPPTPTPARRTPSSASSQPPSPYSTPPATAPAQPASAAGKTWWKRWWVVALGGLVLLTVLAGIFAPSEEEGDEETEQVIGDTDAEAVEEAGQADDDPEPQASEPPAATSEAQPTPTAEPTPTPEATATPEPTPTPEPPGFGGGVQLVGSDIEPGTYATGEVGFCYWERLAGLSGELTDIIANDNAIDEGQVLVEVAAGDVAFNSDGCGRWELIDAIELPARAAPADGDWLVGRQIEPGVYRTVGEPEFCYWQRSSGLSGELADIIANDNVLEGRATVEIQPGDVAFTSSGCGDWERS